MANAFARYWPAWVVVAVVSVLPAAYGLDNLLLFDGEGTVRCEYGAPDGANAFRGEQCFKATPDYYHSAMAALPEQTFRKNITGYEELWLFVKSDVAGDTGVYFHVETYGGVSKKVLLHPYADDKRLDGTYSLVRVPIADLKTESYAVNAIDLLYFTHQTLPSGKAFYVDEMWAIDLDTMQPETMPLLAHLPPVDYGAVALGTNATRNISVSNLSAVPLSITDCTVDEDDFTVLSYPAQIPPGQTAQIAVRFAPGSPGDIAGTLTITHSTTAFGEVTEAVLRGAGQGGKLTVAPPALDFGSRQIGGYSAWPVTLTNAGNEAVSITGVTASNASFSLNVGTVSLAPQESRQFEARFTPTATGRVSGTLSIASNDPLNPTGRVDVVGEGIAAGATGHVNVLLHEVTSQRLRVSWNFASGATAYKVWLGAEPAATAGGVLPKAVLWQEYGPTVNACEIGPLAGAVEVFVRVEAVAGSSVIAATNLHTRTVGGPRAAIEKDAGATFVREVHMMSPRILQVVMANYYVKSYTGATGTLEGYTGDAWQAGPWKVSRFDGTPIAIEAVNRHSVPVGQPYYRTTPVKEDHQEYVDVDHRIYLRLQAPIGSGSVVKVEGPTGTFYIPFSDKYLETPAVQLNQVGYSPRATERWAYISGWLGDGGTLPLGDFPASAEVLIEPEDRMAARTVAVSSLPISVRAQNDEDSGGEVRQINLATMPPAEATVYRVRIPGVGVSWPTQVSETALFKAFFIVTRGLYFNRFGRDLRADCTEWVRPPDHQTIYTGELKFPNGYPAFGFGDQAMFPENTPRTGERAQRGGHHNAGDFDIQLSDHVIALHLMRAFELNTAAFTDGQLMIPESGNGIPDLLDEALWNIDGWAQLQEADGGVRGGAESFTEPGHLTFADEDELPYWTYSRHPVFTATAAALFAQASRLVAPYAPERAAGYRERAIRAYDYALANGVDATWHGPILHAAAELYLLTGEAKYQKMFNDADQSYSEMGIRPGDIGRLTVSFQEYLMDTRPGLCGDQVAAYLYAPGATPTVVARLKSNLDTLHRTALDEVQTLHAHRNARFTNPDWGWGTISGYFTQRIYWRMQAEALNAEDAQQAYNAQSMSADYSLGGNPEGMCWITGLGSRHPKEPLHLDSICFMAEGKEAVPGITVFGPTQELPGNWYYDRGRHVFYPPVTNHPLMRRYGDIRSFVTQNEGGSAMSAAQTQLFAVLLGTGLKPAESWKPGNPEHRNPLAPRENLLAPTPPDDDDDEDVTAPTVGTVSVAAMASTSPVTVNYAGVADADSGVKTVALWAKAGTGAWQDTGLTATGAAGTFSFAPTGDGTYAFAVRAEDNAGNLSAVPSGAGSATLLYDATPPTAGTLTSPERTSVAPIAVSYSGAQDAGSGLQEVRLWVKKGAGAWTNTGLTSTAASGSFSFSGLSGEGPYYFYLQAVDKAGVKNPDPTDALVGVN